MWTSFFGCLRKSEIGRTRERRETVDKEEDWIAFLPSFLPSGLPRATAIQDIPTSSSAPSGHEQRGGGSGGPLWGS